MYRLTVLFFVTLLAACGGGSSSGTPTGGSPVANNAGDLVSSSVVKTLPRTAAAGSPSISAFPAYSVIPQTKLYDVDYYALTYLTKDPGGNLINASGLLLVPKKSSGGTSPLLSLHHGTLVYEPWAPSYANGTIIGTGDETQIGFVAASTGYIVMMPDYLGYGVSINTFHPYVHAQTLAGASIDLIRASKKFLTQHNIAVNNQLFLGGYSEGGYATLATQRQIETNLASEFTITAAESGSGPYNMSATSAAAFASTGMTGITDPLYLAFLLKAYDRYYNTPSQISSYLTTTALACTNSYFTGTYGILFSSSPPGYTLFNNCVNTMTTNVILQQTFLDAFNNGGETTLKVNIAKNDIYDWRPQVPTRLFYSPSDEVVPGSNTTITYNTMRGNGSTTVETVVCDALPATHGNCSTPFVIDLFNYFAGNALNL